MYQPACAKEIESVSCRNTEKSYMNALNQEYERIMNSQDFCENELDYSILDRHIQALDQIARMSNSGVTIYDMYQRKHVFTSYNFPDLFDYNMERIMVQDSKYFNSRIHPDDLYPLTLNGIKCMRHVLDGRTRRMRYKLIHEYRIRLGDKYARVIEEFQVLEWDPKGNIWLSLSLLNISPNQTPFTRVESRMFDMDTRELIALPDYPEYKVFGENKAELTNREKEVLGLVRQGFLSKEISDRMHISLNTVNTYRQRIIEKLEVNNSQEAIRYAEKFGLLD